MKQSPSMLFAVALAGCGTFVRPDVGAPDASIDTATLDAAIDHSVPDRSDADASESLEADAIDATDAVDAPDAVNEADAAADAPLIRRCATPEPPVGMELPGTNRSCDPDGGAPPEHCREVWQCGGTVNIYEPPAVLFTESGPGFSASSRVLPDCGGTRNIAVHAGYVDAYEVSVARFRAWVRAGMPTPDNERMFPGQTVTEDRREFLRTTRFDRESGAAVAQPEVCTYRDAPGENDDLPMNCVGRAAASYFCWWEGKHLVTDAAWVFVAGNSEWRTTYPFSVDRGDVDLCTKGDFGRGNACPGRAGLPDPIDRYPLGATLHPPRIFGIYGGVTEFTWGAGVPFDHMAFGAVFCSVSHDEILGSRFGNFFPARGLAAYHSLPIVQALREARHRTSASPAASAARWIGFRCSRWVPELR